MIETKRRHRVDLYNLITMLILAVGLFCFGSVVVLLLFFSKCNYPRSVNNYVSNAALLIPAAVLLAIFIIYIKKYGFNNKDNGFIDKAVIISLPVFFLFQLYVFSHIYFESGWDAGYILDMARSMVNGDSDYLFNTSSGYFSKCQNNLLLALISGQILKLNSAIGIFGEGYDLMAIVVVNCLISLLTSYLVYKLLRILVRDSRFALFGYIITIILCTLSPWNVITYSDPFCLIFPVLILYLYIKPNINFYLRWSLLAAVGYIGYRIKPTVVIIFIALFGIRIIDHIHRLIKQKKLSFKEIKKKAIVIAFALSTIILLNTFINYQYNAAGFTIDDSKKYSMYHFLMMGQNDPTMGVYYGYDVVFSDSFKDYETRKSAAQEKIIERIKNRGIVGQIDFTARKVLSDFNDGSFAWSMEGHFYKVLKPELSKASSFLRSIYYSNGERYSVFKISTHFFWWLTILLVLFSVIGEIYTIIKKNESNRIYMIILAALIGISMYDALFETRARYLYIYVPLFIICAIYGLAFICNGKFTAAEESQQLNNDAEVNNTTLNIDGNSSE